MLQRVLEPEVMDTAEEAIDYNQMDHSHVNRLFVDDFLLALSGMGLSPSSDGTSGSLTIFVAGTGTALIPIELMRRGIPARVSASDLAEAMLVVARDNVCAAGLESSIQLVLRDCKKLPEATASFDAVMSNSIVHHIPQPGSVLKELWRVLKPGGLMFVRDLMRPDDVETLESLVTTYAGDANTHQKQMFRDSLHAALTVEEVRELVRDYGLSSDSVKATSDRHWTIQGKKESPGRTA